TAVKAAEPPASPEHPGVVVKALPAPDPGARRLAEAIAARVVGVAPIAVEVGPLRNYSRASMDEFDALHERVAALLGRAGGPLGLTFDATAAAPYRLEGSAYLLPRFGTDTWEVYVRLMAADGATIWEPTGPVYLLRQARPNGLQIAFSAEALAATAEQP
ncbi:MAG: hypothetical protein KDA25_00905, partial [Phycisphaerales bacterium]|nr:hypothetical protein [Phycisphaerales bacterium]